MEKDFNLQDLLRTISKANNMVVSVKGTWESVEKNKITFDCDSENGGSFNGQFFIYNLDRQNGILSLYISDMGLSIERVFRINIMDEQTFVLTDSRGHRETFFKRG